MINKKYNNYFAFGRLTYFDPTFNFVYLQKKIIIKIGKSKKKFLRENNIALSRFN